MVLEKFDTYANKVAPEIFNTPPREVTQRSRCPISSTENLPWNSGRSKTVGVETVKGVTWEGGKSFVWPRETIEGPQNKSTCSVCFENVNLCSNGKKIKRFIPVIFY